MKKILLMILSGGLALPAAAFDFGNLQDALKTVQHVHEEVKQATEDVPEPKEIEMGGGIASNLLGAAPLLKNRAVQKYVNDVAAGWRCKRNAPICPGNSPCWTTTTLTPSRLPAATYSSPKGCLCT